MIYQGRPILTIPTPLSPDWGILGPSITIRSSTHLLRLAQVSLAGPVFHQRVAALVNNACNGSCDKNGSGTMPANEHVRYGNDARNGLCEKNGSGQSAAFLKVPCGSDARNGLYDKNGSGQQHPVWGFTKFKRV